MGFYEYEVLSAHNWKFITEDPEEIEVFAL